MHTKTQLSTPMRCLHRYKGIQPHDGFTTSRRSMYDCEMCEFIVKNLCCLLHCQIYNRCPSPIVFRTLVCFVSSSMLMPRCKRLALPIGVLKNSAQSWYRCEEGLKYPEMVTGSEIQSCLNTHICMKLGNSGYNK